MLKHRVKGRSPGCVPAVVHVRGTFAGVLSGLVVASVDSCHTPLEEA
jgi:hypothetical protein